MTQNADRLPVQPANSTKRGYNLFLLLVAGMGGLIYGIDVGIIGGALPYLEATSHLDAAQLSVIVAAVLLGSVLSTLFAGLLADWLGRKPLMILSGLTFVFSIPVIALSQGYGPLFLGRLLQGISGGFIGVVVPLYLAECLSARDRGKGTGVFQWLLTLGIVAAALMGMYSAIALRQSPPPPTRQRSFPSRTMSWRRIFWVSLPPGVLFVLGSLLVAIAALALSSGVNRLRRYALCALRGAEQAGMELREMDSANRAAQGYPRPGCRPKLRDSLLRRKYIIPFLLACLILFAIRPPASTRSSASIRIFFCRAASPIYRRTGVT